MELNNHKDGRIGIERDGTGWRSMIYVPNCSQPITGSRSDDPFSKKLVLEKAKKIIEGWRA